MTKLSKVYFLFSRVSESRSPMSVSAVVDDDASAGANASLWDSGCWEL